MNDHFSMDIILELEERLMATRDERSKAEIHAKLAIEYSRRADNKVATINSKIDSKVRDARSALTKFACELEHIVRELDDLPPSAGRKKTITRAVCMITLVDDVLQSGIVPDS